MTTLNANSFPVTPSIVDIALAKSGLEWVMSRAQQRAIEIYALQSFVELTVEKPADVERIKISFPPVTRLMAGIPIVVDQTIPDGVIELRHGSKVLGRIENLAIPCGMERL